MERVRQRGGQVASVDSMTAIRTNQEVTGVHQFPGGRIDWSVIVDDCRRVREQNHGQGFDFPGK